MESVFAVVLLLLRALLAICIGIVNPVIERLELRVLTDESLENFLVDRLNGVAHICGVYVI